MSTLPVPDPRLVTVRNRTPFAMFQCDKMGPGRRFYDTVVVKGTFAQAPGKLELATDQAPVALADEYWDPGAAERSSLKHAGEALLVKPGTDVLVTGTVRPPGGSPLPDWDAAIAVQRGGHTVLDYRVQVTGPRRFRHTSAHGWTLTDPEPTDQVPIRYELAYGGAYPDPASAERPWVVHPPNPSGTGFFDERTMATGTEYRAPQWQARAHPVTAINHEVPLAGIGPVARPWSSRLGFAGTYDEAWERATRVDVQNGLPADYAADFNPRFFQCAHPELIAATHLAGDEEIALDGMVPGMDRLTMRLPGRRLDAHLLDGHGAWHEERMRLDTVHVNLDSATVHLCWRITLDQERDIRTALIFRDGRRVSDRDVPGSSA